MSIDNNGWDDIFTKMCVTGTAVVKDGKLVDNFFKTTEEKTGGRTMKLAQDYLSEYASGETRGGFNSRLQGESRSKCMSGIDSGSRWGERNNGWELADELIRKGKIFSMSGDVEFKCMLDGDTWFCHGPDFIDLMASDNYVFADTREKAIEEFCDLVKEPK